MELYSYPLSGLYFREDNKEVFRLLSDHVKDQPATWIQSFQASQNGHGAWLALVQHYNGGGMMEKRINKAESTLSLLFYNNERVFSFDAYAAKMLGAFCTLEYTPNRQTPGNQTKLLLDNIGLNTANIAVIKGHVGMHYRSNSGGAIKYISREISETFPNVLDHSRRTGRNRYISAVDSGLDSNRARNFDGLQQNNGVFTFYGVDVTNVHRRFSSQEMTTLGPRGQAYIYQERAHSRGGSGDTGSGRGRSGRYGGRGRGRGIAAVHREENNITIATERTIAATTTATSTSTTDRGSRNGQLLGPAITTRMRQPRRDAVMGRLRPRK